jgi:2-phosphoglycerate kinase
MRLRLGDDEVPFPLFTVSGKLRLSGLDDQAISEILQDSVAKEFQTNQALVNHIAHSLESYDSETQTKFNTLIRYDSLRGENQNIPAIILVIEGASATGKSLIALELMRDLAATRFISTDTVRLVLRGIMNEEKHPELFCHTYQAHIKRQIGPEELDPVLRGFLAQCEIISPHIESMTRGMIEEGANTLVEGVHISPGSLSHLSQGVVEVLIDPDPVTHKAMFVGKSSLEKLTTVSEDLSVREKEFEAALIIQDYMRTEAEKSDTVVIPLRDYDEARRLISSLIISKMEGFLEGK